MCTFEPFTVYKQPNLKTRILTNMKENNSQINWELDC